MFYKTDGSVGLTYKGSSGNIGIGTDSPSAKLDVTGSARLIDSSPTLTLQDSDESNVFASIIQSSGSLFLRSRDGSSNGSIVFQKQNSSGITESMRIDDSGNVGIGTSSPVTKAHIKGDGLTVEQDSGSRKIQIIAPVSGEDSVIRNSGTSAGFDFQNNPSGDGSTFIDLMTIDSSGNVGIGTATPSAKLEVNSGTTNTVAKFISSDSGAGIVLTDNTGSSTIQQTDKILRIGVDEDSSVTDSAISFRVDNSEKMRIDDTGNVGIGTTSPLGKLMVRDDTAGTPTRLIVSNGGTAESGTSARLSFYEGTSEKGYIERRKDGSGKIAFVTPADDNPFVWENPTGEIMRIDNGNVGIGTTSPSQKLEVSGSALIDSGSTNTALLLRSSDPNVLIDFVDANTTSGVQVGANSNDLFLSTGNSERMRIDSTGNVGIGTDSPLGKLHVNGASDGNSIYTAMLQNAGTAPNTASKLLFVQGGSTIRGAVIGGLQEATAGSPTSMVFETSAAYATPTERMRITSAGNVGIGTTSPNFKLHVDGGSAMFDTDGGNNPLYIARNSSASESLKIYVDDAEVLFESIQDETGGDHGRFAFKMDGDSSDAYTRWLHGSTERMRLTAGGNLGIGTTAPNASALLDVSSTTKGVLLPRMNTTQINAISSPAEGLTVYNTVLSTLCFFNGVSWQKVTSTAM